ncbi:ESPR-type extended signal peptide-containing protein [Moraxella catarrhalis]|uniref:ESPR-type extended signal peptide-containing protein n=1 Tax=Moraxella catarrhalis TaxID=480 RepID=UPI003B969246
MNHIYKVIFNKATGTFMAVAEYAKSHTRGGGSCATGQVGSVCTLSFARVAALAVLVIGATLSGSAYAQQTTKIEIGTTNNASNSNATATGEASIAIGSLAKAEGNQALAIGGAKPNGGNRGSNAGSYAKGQESIAIGGDVLAEGHASIAIGSDDLYLKEEQIKLINFAILSGTLKEIYESSETDPRKYRRTHAQGHASTAVGAMSYAQGHFSNAFGTRATAEGTYSLAVGLTAYAKAVSSIAVGSNAQANKFGATAVGGSTQVDLNRGIALGFGSQILQKDNDKDNNVSAYVPQGKTLESQYRATRKENSTDIFSIGNSNGDNSIRRKIINVGAGSQDTDAVNVKQLRLVEELANRKITFKGDDGNNKVLKGLGDTLNITGGAQADNLADGDNIGVVKDDNMLNLKLAKDLEQVDTKPHRRH